MIEAKRLTIIMYHYVRPIKNSLYPNIKGLEFHDFKNQLDYLSKEYTFITAEHLIAYSLKKGDLPKNACYLTFDDGYKDHIDFVLPELLSRKIQGSFFPPAQAVLEREMLDVNALHFILASTSNYEKIISEILTKCKMHGIKSETLSFLKHLWAKPSKYDDASVMLIKNLLQHALPSDLRGQIVSDLFNKYVGRELVEFAEELYLSVQDVTKLIESGMYVGSHGYKHTWLDKEEKERQEEEIDLSLEFLERVGAPTHNWIMCYPYGSYNQDTLEILKKKNCVIGLTAKSDFATLNADRLLELNRFDTNDFCK